jgi:hypothetical protein
MDDEKTRFEAGQRQEHDDLHACQNGDVTAGFLEGPYSAIAQGIARSQAR